MTTPEPPTSPSRRLLHSREVICRGYARDDGLLDIEGRMVDTSGVETELPFKVVPAGGTIHDMRLVMTIDADMVIHRLATVTDTGATPYCAEINAAYAALEGLKIGPGFKQQVKARVGGVKGCTHLTEMMGAMGTTAMQTMFSIKRAESSARRARDPLARRPRPWVIDTCHAYRADGEAARIVWPIEHRE